MPAPTVPPPGRDDILHDIGRRTAHSTVEVRSPFTTHANAHARMNLDQSARLAGSSADRLARRYRKGFIQSDSSRGAFDAYKSTSVVEQRRRIKENQGSRAAGQQGQPLPIGIQKDAKMHKHLLFYTFTQKVLPGAHDLYPGPSSFAYLGFPVRRNIQNRWHLPSLAFVLGINNGSFV